MRKILHLYELIFIFIERLKLIDTVHGIAEITWQYFGPSRRIRVYSTYRQSWYSTVTVQYTVQYCRVQYSIVTVLRTVHCTVLYAQYQKVHDCVQYTYSTVQCTRTLYVAVPTGHSLYGISVIIREKVFGWERS